MTPDRISAALGREPRRVLVLSPHPRVHAERWAGRAVEVAVRSERDPVVEGSGPWDVVILDGALEQERWDRWLLQRLHREMADGALLVLRVDHLLDLGSWRGIADFSRRALREIRRRFARRGVIPLADRSAFRPRRYRPGALAAMVAGVAFDVTRVAADGHGWPAPLAALLGPLAPRTASHLALTARRLPSLWGAGRPYPEASAIESRFRATHATGIATRDAWAARIGCTGPARELDVAAMAAGGVLVLSPHPDDEVIGCGGTLLDIAARGGAVTIVQVTDGSDSAAFISEPEAVRCQVRLDEAERVASAIPASELLCLRADNRRLRATADRVAQVREAIARTRPGTVFAPSFIDIHPDHQTVLRLLRDALLGMPEPLPQVALYEVWSLVPHTVVNDVGRWMPRIEELLLTYVTALKVDDYVHMVAERLLFHAYAHRGQPGYVEGFEIHPGRRFLELAESHFGAGGPA